jgi:hypothetical protein
MEVTNFAQISDREARLGPAAGMLRVLGTSSMGIPAEALKKAHARAGDEDGVGEDEIARTQAGLACLFDELYSSVTSVDVADDDATVNTLDPWRYPSLAGPCLWKDEVEVAQSVLGAALSRPHPQHLHIRLTEASQDPRAVQLVLDVVQPSHRSYPEYPPVLVVRDEHNSLADHKCMQLTQSVLLHIHHCLEVRSRSDAGGVLLSVVSYLKDEWECLIVGPSTLPLPPAWETMIAEAAAARAPVAGSSAATAMTAEEAVRSLKALFSAKGLSTGALTALANHVNKVYRSPASALLRGKQGFSRSPFARYMPSDPAASGAKLKSEQERRLAEDSRYQTMLASRGQLPLMKYQDEILDMVAKHQVIVLRAETGAGTSTLLPTFIFTSLFFPYSLLPLYR